MSLRNMFLTIQTNGSWQANESTVYLYLESSGSRSNIRFTIPRVISPAKFHQNRTSKQSGYKTEILEYFEWNLMSTAI
jgi:hypothetical protein